MNRNTSVTFGEPLNSFISEQVKSSHCCSTNDAVRAELLLLEEHEVKAKGLQDALLAGEQSGEPQPFDFEVFKARKRAEYEGR